MATIRIHHKKRYTVISNDAVRDSKLSWAARGLHHYLLSFPDDWEVNVKHLVCSSEKDGNNKIYSLLKELRAAGYVVQKKLHTGKVQYTVFELPQNPNQENPNQDFRDVYERTNQLSTELELKTDLALTGEKTNAVQLEERRAEDKPVKPGDPYFAKRVKKTAKEVAIEIIEEFCPWKDFYEARRAYLMDCDYYRDKQFNIVEGTVLRHYVNAIQESRTPWKTQQEAELAIAELRETIQTHVRELGLDAESAAQQPQQQPSGLSLDEMLVKHEKDPTILNLSPAAFYREFGVEKDLFTRHLFKQGVI